MLVVNEISLVITQLTFLKLVFQVPHLEFFGTEMAQWHLNLVKVLSTLGVPMNELDKSGWYVLHMFYDGDW